MRVDGIDRPSSEKRNVNPQTDTEIEQRVTQTLSMIHLDLFCFFSAFNPRFFVNEGVVRLLNQIPADRLGDIQSQQFNRILIDENDGGNESLLRDGFANHSTEEATKSSEKIRIQNNREFTPSPNSRVNYVSKSVRFPKNLNDQKCRKKTKKLKISKSPKKKSKSKNLTPKSSRLTKLANQKIAEYAAESREELDSVMMKAFEDGVQAKRKSLEKERNLLREERKKYSDMLKADLNQNNEYLQEIEVLKKDNIKLTEENQHFKASNKSLKRASFSIKELKSKESQEVSKKQDQINILEEKVSELQKRLYEEQKNKGDDKKKEIENLNKQWEAQTKEAVEKVTEEFDALNEAIKQKDREISKLNLKLPNLEEEVIKYSDEIDQFQTQIKQLERENKKLEKHKEDAESRFITQNDTEAETDKKLQEWKDKHNALEGKYWKKDEDIEKLRNELRNLKKNHAQEVRELKSEADGYKQQLSEAENMLQEQDMSLKGESIQNETLTQQKDSLISEMKIELDEVNSKIQELESENEDLTERNHELDEIITQLRDEKN